MSGRGTAAGIVFQAEVGALVAAAMLSERPMARIALGLLGSPTRILFETPGGVDDVVVETDRGQIYFQAKRTISLSPLPTSDLASVAAQFVRQYREGAREDGQARRLDPARDRLALAVGDETLGPVANHLREALDRNRTAAATAMPDKLTHALAVFSGQIDAAWMALAEDQLNDVDRQALLALCSVVNLTDTHRQLAEEALREVVANLGAETDLFDQIRDWAAVCSSNGTGGTVSTLRLALSSGTALREPPSFTADVHRLSEYCGSVMQRLGRFRFINAPEGPIAIDRSVAAAIARAAMTGSLAITGEPGSGKSAIVHAVSKELSRNAPVVTLTVDASSISSDALRAELGLQHPLIEVLTQMPGPRPAYFLLDALDAARGGSAEATYKRLIEDISNLPGWHVVASVRSFDLQMGRDWKRLFAGVPPDPPNTDARFPAVRHVHVGLLTDADVDTVAAGSPTLAAAISAGGAKLAAVTRNPFNAALLADLLLGGAQPSAFSNMGTRGDLIDRYWNERIADLGLPATVSLRALVEQMVQERSVDIAETDVPMAAAATVDELQRVGVLVIEQTRRLGFRHHVLFDYAVSRLLLLPDKRAALTRLDRTTGAGLLITPSIGYWVTALTSQTQPSEFWTFTANLLCNEAIDPIVRVEFGRLAIEAFQSGDVAALGQVLAHPTEATAKTLQYIVGSLLTKAHVGEQIDVAPWARLLSELTSPTDQQVNSMTSLVGTLLEGEPTLESLADLGLASRTLFDYMSADERRIPWLAPRVVGHVANTFGSDVSASRQRLSQLFEQPRFERVGHIEVPWLAEDVGSIAPHDPEFAAEIHYRVFLGGNFSRDQVTPMSNSWIVSLRSNAAQDFKMGEHRLSQNFPSLVATLPEAAFQCLAAVLNGERDKGHRRGGDDAVVQIQLGNASSPFEEDNSYIWAWNLYDDRHDDYAVVYRAAISAISGVSGEDTVAKIPQLMLSQSGAAIVWRSIFELAANRALDLGLQVWEAAATSVALSSLSTRRSAIALLAAVYPSLDAATKVMAERDWLGREVITFGGDERRRTILATLFGAIGSDQLATAEARAYLDQATADGSAYENQRPVSYRASWVDRGISNAAVDPLDELAEAVRAARQALSNDPSDSSWSALWSATLMLFRAVEALESSELSDEVTDALAIGLGFSLSRKLVPDDLKTRALLKLLELTDHANPQTSLDTETQFDETHGYSMPAPRVSAADGLSRIARIADDWPLVRERYTRLLLSDRHPAVRYELVDSLPAIVLHDPDFWQVVETFARDETSRTVLESAIAALSCLPEAYGASVERIVLANADAPPGQTGDDPVASLIGYYAVLRGYPASRAKLHEWVANYGAWEDRIRRVVLNNRESFLAGIDTDDEGARGEREQTRDFANQLIGALEPALRSWPDDGQPTDSQITAIKLFDEIASQLYFAVGHGQMVPALSSLPAQQRFLSEYSALISKLTTLGTPNTVHRLLEVLSNFVEVDPEHSFDLISEALLRTTGVAKYEHESLGAALFVTLVGRFLADHRSIFDDVDRRRKLIDCFAIFVEAGWPQARRLFHTLPELLG